jgi:hypothetical protein
MQALLCTFYITGSYLISVYRYERTRKTLQELRKALAGNIKNNAVRQKRLIKMIAELAQYCKTSDGHLNVQQHQDLIRDFKIHEQIIQVQLPFCSLLCLASENSSQ